MAVSCPEVMYGAYYPYLYGRGAARSFHHAPPFQYDRFNVQSGSNVGNELYGPGVSGAAALSSGASSGAHSPASPPHAHLSATAIPAPRLRTKEEDLSAHSRQSADGGASSDSEGECSNSRAARAQYVSANCVVFTHYSGDVAAVVDEHFAKALSVDKNKGDKKAGSFLAQRISIAIQRGNAASILATIIQGPEYVPLQSRNLPASFFNSQMSGGGEFYDYHHDPWHQHYQQYTAAAAHHHRAVHEYHAHAHAHHNMAGYPGLLLGGARLPHHQYKDWGAQHASHHLDPSSYSYPTMAGLEAQVQDTSKDLYWF